MGKITTKEYKIKYYEVDCNRNLLVTSLINYFSDICMTQLLETGYTLDKMNDMKRAWVLYKWDINIKRYPIYGESVNVTTEAYSFKKFYAVRLFRVTDKEGNEIINALSIWFFIDTERRRPMKISSEMYSEYEIPEDKNDIPELPKIEKQEDYEFEKAFNVRYSDIDTNMHVNNAKYLSWMIETIPLSIVNEFKLENARIDYEKETQYGEKVNSYTKVTYLSEEKICCYHIITDENNKELTVGKSIWVKK